MEDYSLHKIGSLKTLIVKRPKNAKLVYIQFMVGVGSDLETNPDLEIGHFLEHLFASLTSSKYPSAKKNQDLFSEHNIIYSASIESKTTIFEYSMIKSKVRLFLDVFIRALMDFKVDEETFKTEQQSIIEELNEIIDDNNYDFTTKTDQILYANHIRATDEKKRLENTKKMTANQIYTYWKRTYKPEVSLLGIYGNVKLVTLRNRILAIQKEYVSPKLSKKNKSKNAKRRLALYYPSKFKLKPIKESNLFFMEKNDEISQLKISIKVDMTTFSDDFYKLFALDFVLTNDLNSLLMQKLRIELGLVYDIESSFTLDESQPSLSYFFIETTVSADKIEEVFKETMKILYSLTKTKLKKYYLQRYRQIQTQFALLRNEQLEYNDSLNKYLKNVMFCDKVITLEQEDKKILKVNEEDILKLAKKIFIKDRIFVAYCNKTNLNERFKGILEMV